MMSEISTGTASDLPPISMSALDLSTSMTPAPVPTLDLPVTWAKASPFRAGCRFVKLFVGGGRMENMGSVRRAVAVEVESPPPELSAVEEAYRRIVEEAAVYVAERGTLERGRREELYRRFRELYPWLHSQLVQQAINQGVEAGKSFLEARRDGRTHKPSPEVRRVAIRFAKDSWSYKRAVGSAAPVRLALSLPGGRGRSG